MSLPQILRITLGAVCLAVRVWAADDAATPLTFDRLELTDGRKLQKVTVKSYDAASDKLLLIASGKAMILPLGLLPEDLRKKLKEAAPPAGDSTSSTPAPKDNAVTVTSPEPSVPRVVTPSPAPENPEGVLKAHKDAALHRAQNYYRSEFPLGSDAAKVTSANFELEEPEPVDGWLGRYRTQGKVYLEFFDSKGYSYKRTTSQFEVLTEKPSGKALKVLDFSVKS